MARCLSSGGGGSGLQRITRVRVVNRRLLDYVAEDSDEDFVAMSSRLRKMKKIPRLQKPNNEPQVHQQQEGYNVVITLTDPEVLDCPICCEPLTTHVYECDQNGHIACSSCSAKIENKCPSCSGPFGSKRCRAIEKVLESCATPCQNIKYGCKEPVSYHKKEEHQRACMYSPCICPNSSCNFVSSAKQLYQHFSCNHADSSTTRFEYSQSFRITLNAGEIFFVIQEKNEGTLFILMNHCVEDRGNDVMLICIQPDSMGGYFYDLVVKTKGNFLRLQSFTKSSPRLDLTEDSPPKIGYLSIPCGFISSSGQLKMDLCIWPQGQCPPYFRK